MYPSGVAEVTTSETGSINLVIEDGNETNITIRAAIAGLAKLQPIPPNICFTTIIAKTLPIAACHKGNVGGRFIPSSSPVTTADRSFAELGFLSALSHKNSLKTAVKTQTASTAAARIPKSMQP